LYESRAIARYIEAKYPEKGIKLAPPPTDLNAYALFEQAASVELANFFPHASGAVFEKIIKPWAIHLLLFTYSGADLRIWQDVLRGSDR